MNAFSRRSFLRKASIGAAAGAMASRGLVTNAAGAMQKQAERTDPIQASDDRVVAFVRAGDRDEVTVLVGEREIVRRDARLARLLLRAAR
ncbi:MAG TPA: twin-arginine translocation signal domain-containing protein [Actinomycetota bacterium]|jgi:hypothetical protein|nr:twin-arginine translocation signal domain-containing protein [Actinomycetota bacterium]